MKANLLLLVIGLFFGTGAGFLLGQQVEAPAGHDHDHAAHGEPHDDAGPMTHDHSALLEGPVASVAVTALPDGPGALNVRIVPTGMTFAPEAVNAAHVAGQGHAHVYVNGVKEARVYGEWVHLSGLPSGPATLRVTLNANSHEQLAHDGTPIETVTEVVIP
ncbi:hypothetical protein [Pseudooceanicola onchidii]|uniref:hypothetical protein n=1 Tax=Pseudooceanicola onchidii TaxID=2562279 RepID=UPI0010A9B9B4|nr:hypothetical protein [Pseudooceanicola onchidii]